MEAPNFGKAPFSATVPQCRRKRGHHRCLHPPRKARAREKETCGQRLEIKSPDHLTINRYGTVGAAQVRVQITLLLVN